MCNTNNGKFIDYTNFASGNAPDSNNVFTACTKTVSEVLGLVPDCRSKFQITAP